MAQGPSDQPPTAPQQFIALLPALSSRRDCLRLRGLPPDAKVETVLDFLGVFSRAIVYQGVHMIFNSHGQPAGEAFVQMGSEDAAFLAAFHRHGHYIMAAGKQRYIEVLQCSVDDMNQLLADALPVPTFVPPAPGTAVPVGIYPPGTRPMLLPGAAPALPAPGPEMYVPPTAPWPYPSPPASPAGRNPTNVPSGITMVLLRGLPYSASVRDILAFLDGFPSLTVDSVHIQRNADGRPSGEAIVAFPTRAEAERAVRLKHRQHMGSRYIELFIG